MRPDIIVEALRRAGATIEGETEKKTSGLTKQDMMELGLSGGKDSSYLRKKLLARLEFPEHMSSNAMLQALDLLFTKEELEKHILALENEYDRHSS